MLGSQRTHRINAAHLFRPFLSEFLLEGIRSIVSIIILARSVPIPQNCQFPLKIDEFSAQRPCAKSPLGIEEPEKIAYRQIMQQCGILHWDSWQSMPTDQPLIHRRTVKIAYLISWMSFCSAARTRQTLCFRPWIDDRNHSE